MYLLQQTGGGMSNMIFIVVMIGVFYFFMIRPQMKKAKEQKNFREALKVGDKVVTTGGIHGSITELNEQFAVIQLENGKMKVEKAALTASFDPIQKK